MITVITPLAYDYRYAFAAIKAYYPIADEILLGLDKDRISWSGKPFDFDVAEFERFLAVVDTRKIVTICEGNFHTYDKPMDNDTAEHNSLSMMAKPGNWVVNVDSDEVLLNPAEFKAYMETAPEDCVIIARLLNVFKTFPSPDGDKMLLIEPPKECAFFGTMLRGGYMRGRATDQKGANSPGVFLHFAWGRKREELMQKLNNWGHSRDFDVEKYMEFWDSITLENWQEPKDFHPLDPHMWPRLSAPLNIIGLPGEAF